MSLTAFHGRCPTCGYEHRNQLHDYAVGMPTKEHQQWLDKKFDEYAKTKPHLYGSIESEATKPISHQITSGGAIPEWTDEDKARLEVALGEMFKWKKPQEPVAWNEGYPQNPWDTEWFIAKTKYGDKVVLRKLPKEYTHDFTTADGTYMKKENITMWMQFPESEFIAPHHVSDMDILDIVLKISEEMGLEDDEANLEFAQRVIAAATPQPCQSCAEKQSAIDVWEGRYADLSAKCAELEDFCISQGNELAKLDEKVFDQDRLLKQQAEKISATLVALAGLPDGALDGGWTCAGMNKYALGLEAKCAELEAELQFLRPGKIAIVQQAERIAELEAELLSKEGMALVTKEDAENYCRILSLLGMEEEGSPIEGVEHLISLRDGMTCGDCNDTGWLENREEGRYPCTCMTEAEPYQILEAERDEYRTKYQINAARSDERCKQLCEMESERDALKAELLSLGRLP